MNVENLLNFISTPTESTNVSQPTTQTEWVCMSRTPMYYHNNFVPVLGLPSSRIEEAAIDDDDTVGYDTHTDKWILTVDPFKVSTRLQVVIPFTQPSDGQGFRLRLRQTLMLQRHRMCVCWWCSGHSADAVRNSLLDLVDALDPSGCTTAISDSFALTVLRSYFEHQRQFGKCSVLVLDSATTDVVVDYLVSCAPLWGVIVIVIPSSEFGAAPIDVEAIRKVTPQVRVLDGSFCAPEAIGERKDEDDEDETASHQPSRRQSEARRASMLLQQQQQRNKQREQEEEEDEVGYTPSDVTDQIISKLAPPGIYMDESWIGRMCRAVNFRPLAARATMVALSKLKVESYDLYKTFETSLEELRARRRAFEEEQRQRPAASPSVASSPSASVSAAAAWYHAIRSTLSPPARDALEAMIGLPRVFPSCIFASFAVIEELVEFGFVHYLGGSRLAPRILQTHSWLINAIEASLTRDERYNAFGVLVDALGACVEENKFEVKDHHWNRWSDDIVAHALGRIRNAHLFFPHAASLAMPESQTRIDITVPPVLPSNNSLWVASICTMLEKSAELLLDQHRYLDGCSAMEQQLVVLLHHVDKAKKQVKKALSEDVLASAGTGANKDRCNALDMILLAAEAQYRRIGDAYAEAKLAGVSLEYYDRARAITETMLAGRRDTPGRVWNVLHHGEIQVLLSRVEERRVEQCRSSNVLENDDSDAQLRAVVVAEVEKATYLREAVRCYSDAVGILERTPLTATGDTVSICHRTIANGCHAEHRDKEALKHAMLSHEALLTSERREHTAVSRPKPHTVLNIRDEIVWAMDNIRECVALVEEGAYERVNLLLDRSPLLSHVGYLDSNNSSISVSNTSSEKSRQLTLQRRAAQQPEEANTGVEVDGAANAAAAATPTRAIGANGDDESKDATRRRHRCVDPLIMCDGTELAFSVMENWYPTPTLYEHLSVFTTLTDVQVAKHHGLDWQKKPLKYKFAPHTLLSTIKGETDETTNLLKRLLDMGVDPNACSPHDMKTMLHIAVERNLSAAADVLMRHRNVRVDYSPPFRIAASRGGLSTVATVTQVPNPLEAPVQMCTNNDILVDLLIHGQNPREVFDKFAIEVIEKISLTGEEKKEQEKSNSARRDELQQALKLEKKDERRKSAVVNITSPPRWKMQHGEHAHLALLFGESGIFHREVPRLLHRDCKLSSIAKEALAYYCSENSLEESLMDVADPFVARILATAVQHSLGSDRIRFLEIMTPILSHYVNNSQTLCARIIVEEFGVSPSTLHWEETEMYKQLIAEERERRLKPT